MDRPYSIAAPEPPKTLFRVLSSESVIDSLRSDFEHRIPRRRPKEDAAMHRGISTRATLRQARKLAENMNRSRAQAGSSLPKITGIAEIRVDGAQGHVAARTLRSTGHHTVWAEAEELAATATLWDVEEGLTGIIGRVYPLRNPSPQ